VTYRPQYAYPLPPFGMEDEQFSYSFDGTTIPLLNQSVAAGAQANDIMLPMEQDAPFLCRAIRVNLGTGKSNLSVQLRTPHGDYMALPYVPSSLWLAGTGRALADFLVTPLESEIECPAGSTWTAYLYNPTLASVNAPAITLIGVKRRKCSDKRRAA
jgi:hypothetical protein